LALSRQLAAVRAAATQAEPRLAVQVAAVAVTKAALLVLRHKVTAVVMV
jgi:hypothetical protein